MELENYRKVLRFLISSIVNQANNSNLTDDEIDTVINSTFNVLSNILEPEIAIAFNEEILRYIGKLEFYKEIERKELKEEILKNMKEPKK